MLIDAFDLWVLAKTIKDVGDCTKDMSMFGLTQES